MSSRKLPSRWTRYTKDEATEVVKSLFPETYRQTMDEYRNLRNPPDKWLSWLQETYSIAAGSGQQSFL